MKHIVTKLIIDQLLDDEVDSELDVPRLGGVESELSNDLLIVSIREGTLEDLIDVGLSVVLVEGHFGVKTLLDDV